MTSNDLEKGHVPEPQSDSTNGTAPTLPELDGQSLQESTFSDSKLALWARKVEKVTGVEARGIHRVDESEKSKKTTLSFFQIVIMWLSINTAAQNITLASFGSSVFGL